MRCHIEWKMGTDQYEVFLYWPGDTDGKIRVLQPVGNDAWSYEFVDQGTQIPPSFTLHAEALKVFAKEAAKLPMADEATVAHLKDARETRDRLLRIVEHKMGVSS